MVVGGGLADCLQNVLIAIKRISQKATFMKNSEEFTIQKVIFHMILNRDEVTIVNI